MNAPVLKDDLKTVKGMLSSKAAASQLNMVAAKHMSPERMLRVVALAARNNPTLYECEPMSLLGSIMALASLGLEPNTPMGHAYLIPFKNNKQNITEAQVVIGYKGFIDLAYRSGQVIGIHADVHYSDDELFSSEYGSNQHLSHKPGPRQGDKIEAYCHVRLKNGEGHICVPWADIMRTRDASQGWRSAVRYNKTQSHPWHVHEDRMAAKTAVRRLAGSGEMPMSIEMADAMAIEDGTPDFRGFVENPKAGLSIDGVAEPVEQQVDTPEQVVETAKTSNDTAAAPAEKPAPAKAEAKPNPEPKAEAEPAAEPKTPDPQPAKQTNSTEQGAPDLTQFEKLKNSIINDLQDAGAGQVDKVLDLWRDQIETMEQAAPEMVKEITDTIEALQAE